MSVAIPLNHGRAAFVDEADEALVRDYKWTASCSHGLWYAVSRTQGEMVKMHILIMGRDPMGRDVDHRNGDGLDNRRANLRRATNAQQRQNQKVRSDSVSGYKGVTFYGYTQRWAAYITRDRRKIHLGYFATPEDAARVYDSKAIELFGEFARPNFPEDQEP